MLKYELDVEEVTKAKKEGNIYDGFPLFNPYKHMCYDFTKNKVGHLYVNTTKGVLHVIVINDTLSIRLNNEKLKKVQLHVMTKGKGEIVSNEIQHFYFGDNQEIVEEDTNILSAIYTKVIKEDVFLDSIEVLEEENITLSFRYGEGNTATISIMDSQFTYNIIADIALNGDKKLFSGENGGVSSMHTTIEDITMYSLDFV